MRLDITDLFVATADIGMNNHIYMTSNKTYTKSQLYSFIAESNRIEGIEGQIEPSVLLASEAFLGLETVTVQDMCNIVNVFQPGAELRNKAGLDVRVGNRIPPNGGIDIETRLIDILSDAKKISPFDIHVLYESLHPFTDGNGRTGRLLWAWQMINNDVSPGISLGFLHAFYYQSLENNQD